MSGVARSVRQDREHPVRRKGIDVIIDCERCAVRDVACGDCVVGVLLGMPAVPVRAVDPVRGAGPPAALVDGPSGAAGVQLDAAERRALQVLADQGLVPRLRLVAGGPGPVDRSGDTGFRARDAG
jgi:hypothetical protein